MMKYRKTAALLAAALLGCALLGGCGEDPAPTATEHTPVTTDATTSAPPVELQTTVFEITEDFTSIRVEGGVSDIRLIPTPGSCTVGCTDIAGLEYHAQVEDGTLVIRETGSTVETGAEIVVCLNRPDFETLEITTDGGNVDVTQDFNFSNVALRSASGELGYRGQAEGEMSCVTDSGRILVTGVQPGTMHLQSTGGQIVVQSAQVAQTMQVETVSGNLVLSYVQCANGTVTSQSGEQTLEQLLASESLNIRSDSGAVTLTGCDGASVDIRTTGGTVTGTLQTEKTFTVTAASGTVNVPDTTGGPCSITTDSGTVTLSIGGAA